ncbi:MAG: carboxypeptidase-like regulatory domain-containing protein, partial [Chitinophagales bacterium]
MKFILLTSWVTIALAVVTLPLSAQRVSISGYVKEEENNEALVGAYIVNNTTQEGTATNEYGYFSLQVMKGTCNLSVHYLGFSDKA